MMHRLPVLVLCFLFASTIAKSQMPDSVQVTLVDAEHIFLQKNLSLLAQQYNVDISKAQVQQAKYWDNPVLNTDQNIYDGKFFRHNKDFGQVYIQLQQLVKTAGKRNKLIKLANDNVLSAQQQFNDLLRNLRFVLRNDFTTLNLQFKTWRIYTSEIASLQQLAAGMDAQLQAGNISQKDNIRVKALLYNLQSDAADMQRQIADTEKEFAVLLQVSGDTVFIPQREDTSIVDTPPALTALLDSARNNRPNLQLAQTNIISQQHNLDYQKALVVPDLTIGAEYDQRSSYINNFWGLGISLPLPILNRNKGNIKAAQAGIQQASVQLQQVQGSVKQDVISAYRKLLGIQRLYQSIAPDFINKYNQLMKNMVRSYQDRQIGLLEFIDFFDGWKEAVTNQLEQQTALHNAVEELNYSTGITVIHLK
jgi:cobalt-zinc-cadmium efflux system outer membrane protein